MSGPGLHHVDSHAAIHEAAIHEAEELNDILAKLLREKELEKALEVAYITVEHWESRTLRHADAEERGLYNELVKEKPALKPMVIGLTRDHTILRLLVKEITTLLDNDGMSEAVLQRFQALVLVDIIHNEEEERILAHY